MMIFSEGTKVCMVVFERETQREIETQSARHSQRDTVSETQSERHRYMSVFLLGYESINVCLA